MLREQIKMLRLRFDVDYPYHSRLNSVLYMWGYRASYWYYLNEAKAIALLINASQVDVKAYWFFTPYTLPDKTLLSLLTPDKHVIGLHVINSPEAELAKLESIVGRKVEYYTVHGTDSLAGQFIWHRKIGQKVIEVPKDFPCKNFHEELTHSLDRACYGVSFEKALVETYRRVARGFVLAAHPEWLTKSNGNSRGPYYDVLFSLLSGNVPASYVKHLA